MNSLMPDALNKLMILQQLGSALALGLLIGLERGWHMRKQSDGERVAGLRTYGLISLLGGIFALLAQQIDMLLLGFGFIGLVMVTIAAYYQRISEQNDIGITSVIAILLTFLLGALCTLGLVHIAAPVAVIIALLMSFKPVLHQFLRKLKHIEFYAVLKMLLISVVILPVLPNRTFDPWDALNPYQIWWMVVLIAAISFVGYFAIKITGTRQGMLITGIFGGLASSTAVTLHLSRLTHEQPDDTNAAAAGILAACATMFPRLLIITYIFNPLLGQQLLFPVLLIASLIYLLTVVFWYQSKTKKYHTQQSAQPPLHNPFQLASALQFGLLLAMIMLLSRLMVNYFGDSGIYLLAAASGIADVDAISLSITQMSLQQLPLEIAARAILLAAIINSMVKTSIAFFAGNRQLGGRIIVGLMLPITIAMLIF
ncbi:MgtC family [hydrothermal vent metagenome]|uniref:MgtC family n=1 Tax=hydrothermal vent metagenome TaxID=652676 RepID=A0A3B1B4V4_9ZZZZ